MSRVIPCICLILLAFGTGSLAWGEEAPNLRPVVVEYKVPTMAWTGVFSPDGATFYTARGSGTIGRIDPSTGKVGDPLGEYQKGESQAITVSPDGKLIAIGGEGARRIALIDSKTGKEVRSWPSLIPKSPPGLQEGVTSLAFSPDGKMLASGGSDSVARVWDVSTGKLIKELRDPETFFMSVGFSPDGKTLLTASISGGRAIIWSVEKWTAVVTIQADAKMVTSARFSPDGTLLATTGGEGNMCLWDAATGNLKRKFPTAPERKAGSAIKTWGTSLAFDPSGKVIAHGMVDRDWRTRKDNETGTPNLLMLWDVETGKSLTELRRHTWIIRWLEFSPDGKKLISLGGDGKQCIWDVAYWTKSKK